MSRVKVAVRVRPFSQREQEFDQECVVTMRDNQTIVKGSFTKDGDVKSFTLDHSIWSHDCKDPHFVDQPQVFTALGAEVLSNAFDGYNACVFAYGQTGSGKTYTMMGQPGDDGIIPRLCQELFARTSTVDEGTVHTVEVSYLEIYQERVRDLLAVGDGGPVLKVREHSATGPYVQGLTRLAVTVHSEVEMLMRRGNKLRTTAKTAMNDTSSRSHAVFTLHVSQRTEHIGEKASRISLVDLAGSERVAKTGATGERLKEGAQINKSLSALGLVIKALAAAGDGGSDETFVPYRDSVLTWLLKDSLGGNAKTVMIATISPSIDNIDETISTLRYANSAKQIVNRAVVNEDPKAAMIRGLRDELEMLLSKVGQGTVGAVGDDDEYRRLQDQLIETERLIHVTAASWEDRLKESQVVMDSHRELLEASAARVAINNGALRLHSELPHLVALDGAVMLYALRPGIVRIGQHAQDPPQDILLDRCSGIDAEHCLLEHEPAADGVRDGVPTVTLHPIAECYLNGGTGEVDDSVVLHHGDILRLGPEWTARFNNPQEAIWLKREGRTPAAAALTEREQLAQQTRHQIEEYEKILACERERTRVTREAQLSEAGRIAEFSREEAERVRAAKHRHESESRRLQQTTDEQLELQRKLREVEAAIEKERAQKTALTATSTAAQILRVQTAESVGPPAVSSGVDLAQILVEHQRKHELELQRMAEQERLETVESDARSRMMEHELFLLQCEHNDAQLDTDAMQARYRKAREELATAVGSTGDASRHNAGAYGYLQAELDRGGPAHTPYPTTQPASQTSIPPSDTHNNPFLTPTDSFGLGATASFVASSRSHLAQSQAHMDARLAAVPNAVVDPRLAQQAGHPPPYSSGPDVRHFGEIAVPDQGTSTPSHISVSLDALKPSGSSDEASRPWSPSIGDWEAEMRRLQLDEQLSSDEILARRLQMQDEETMYRADEMRKQQLRADARVASAMSEELEQEREHEARASILRDAELARRLAEDGLGTSA